METVKKIFGKIGRFLRKHIKLVIALVIIAGIVGYVRYSMTKAKQLLEEQANQPVTATVDQMDLTKSVSVTGTLAATDTAKVTSTIGGAMTGVKVKKINYEVGDYVEAGAVVVEFDGDDFDRKITELNAQYNIDNKQGVQDIADLQKTITDTQDKIEETQKKIDEKKKWLDKNKIYYDDIKDAFENGQKDPYSGETERYKKQSEIVLERYGFTIDSYEAKEDEVETLENTLKDLQTQIESAQTKIELAQLRQQFAQNYTQVDAKEDVYESKDATHVEAPISGYIITMNVTEGNNYAQGNTVFTIADTSEFVVEATVNEYNIANIQTGLPAKVKFEATDDETFDGEVSFVSLASEGVIGANQQATGSNVASYKVKIAMKDNDPRMRVGMTAKASVIIDSAKNAICVPYDCVQTDEKDGSFFVNVIDDNNKKKKIKVTKGLESDYYVEVKGEGLKKGMTVEAVVADGPSTDAMDYIYFD